MQKHLETLPDTPKISKISHLILTSIDESLNIPRTVIGKMITRKTKGDKNKREY